MGYIKGGLVGMLIGGAVFGALALSSKTESEKPDNTIQQKVSYVQPTVQTQPFHEQVQITQTRNAETQPIKYARDYNASQELVDFIKTFEKFSGVPYKDAGGILTIGYGHVILSGEKFDSITELQGEEILRKDLTKAENAVKRGITSPLAQNQYDALVSFAFNTGNGGVNGSTLQKRINSGDYTSVPDEMKRWNKVGGKVVKGLVNRREDEVEMFRDGDYVRNH